MKKLLLIALIAFGAWNYYQMQNATEFMVDEVRQDLPDYSALIQKARAVDNTSQFRCDGRQHCSQMTSRAEA